MDWFNSITCRYLGTWCPPPSLSHLPEGNPLEGIDIPDECDDTFDCDRSILTSEEYFYCMLEHNAELNRCMTNIVERSIIADADRLLGLVNGEPEGEFAAYFDTLFSIGRRFNPQTDNWLLLEAALIALNNYQTLKHQDELYRSNEPLEELRAQRCHYLDQALAYIKAALNTPGQGYGFDYARFGTLGYITEEPIPYIEGYFELQAARITIYQSYATEGEANETLYLANIDALSSQLYRELNDFHFVVAMGSSFGNTEGYINRIRLMLNEQLLWDPHAELPALLEDARESYRWSSQQEALPLIAIWYYGMQHKDLVHDTLSARLQEARVELRRNQEGEATQIFQETLFDNLITSREYGGYLDIGTEAFFYLLSIAFNPYDDPTVDNRDAVAERFTELIGGDNGWNWIDTHPDFKETLGLIIRQRDWRSFAPNLPGFQNIQRSNAGQLIGQWMLELGVDWAPANNTSILLELDLSGTVYPSDFSRLAGTAVDAATQDAIFNILQEEPLRYIDEEGKLQPAFNPISQDTFVQRFRDADDLGLTDQQIISIYRQMRDQIQPSNLTRMDLLMHSLGIRYYDHRLLQHPITMWQAWEG